MRTGWKIIVNPNASGSGRFIPFLRFVGVLGFGLPKKFMMNYERNVWNSRGLEDLAKRRFLPEASLEHKLDFIALSETGRDNFAP